MISDGTSAEKRDTALEAAGLYRTLGNPAEAARCISVALMNAEEIQPLSDLEELAQQGLKVALEAGPGGQEGLFYDKLALIAVAKGQMEEAEKYRRWAKDIQESDGLTPLERWKDDVEMTKTLISMCKNQGHKDAISGFKAELKRLKAAKPKR